MHASNTPTEPSADIGAADDAVLAQVLDDANHFVRHLRFPADQHHLYDDIVQDTMLIVHARISTLVLLDLGARRSWTRNTMFFVARNTQRAELRRTATWERLRDAFQHDAIREQFERPDDTLTARFANAFCQLSALEQGLLIGSIWAGHSNAELAEQHQLTAKAVLHRITRRPKEISGKFRDLGAIRGSSGH